MCYISVNKFKPDRLQSHCYFQDLLFMKHLIREEQVKQAAQGNKQIFINNNTVLTPAARDLARELGVVLVHEDDDKKAATRLQGLVQKGPFHKLVIASDHGGFYMKEELKGFLRENGFMVIDLGPANANACDYSDFAIKAAEVVSAGEADCAIMLDSVGIGSAMAANRVRGVLAAKCNNTTEAASAREHNYANFLTLGSKILGITLARDICMTFLKTAGGAERHQKRILKILNYENKR